MGISIIESLEAELDRPTVYDVSNYVRGMPLSLAKDYTWAVEDVRGLLEEIADAIDEFEEN